MCQIAILSTGRSLAVGFMCELVALSVLSNDREVAGTLGGQYADKGEIHSGIMGSVSLGSTARRKDEEKEKERVNREEV